MCTHEKPETGWRLFNLKKKKTKKQKPLSISMTSDKGLDLLLAGTGQGSPFPSPLFNILFNIGDECGPSDGEGEDRLYLQTTRSST